MRTTWPSSPSSGQHTTRYFLVASLLRASALLLRAAVRLQQRPPVTPLVAAPETLEFHAEASAPEGALYVDGRLVGWLTGVTRL